MVLIQDGINVGSTLNIFVHSDGCSHHKWPINANDVRISQSKFSEGHELRP